MALINSDVIPASATASYYDYTIDQSLRFNDDDSAYLSRTPTSSGSQRILTWSGWVKRGNIGSTLRRGLFGSGNQTASNYGFHLTMFNDYLDWHTAGATYRLQSTAVLRDPSAWYHIVLAIDTTQATSSNRQKLYVNGEQVTDFGIESYVPQNTDLQVNTSSYTMVVGAGRDGNTTTYHFDGYLAEVNYIDGQALDPTYFGETGDYGEWKPIRYTGSYGTNGFYLDFDGTYYNDKSGNGNNWTATNLATTDVVLDSPTNNFCTANPLDKYSANFDITPGEGNLYVDFNSDSGYSFIGSTFPVSSGKWYFEFIETNDGSPMVGISDPSVAQTERYFNGITNKCFYYNPNGRTYDGSGSYVQETTWTSGDVIGCAFDLDNGKIWWAKNNTWQNSGNPATGTNASYTTLSGTYVPTLNNGGGAFDGYLNFGQDSSFAGNKTAQGNTDSNSIGDFYYTPPSGYLALCTANLPDPAVIPSEHFNTVLYTGNGGTQSITGVGFQPDFTWLKRRTEAEYHGLFDKVRGATKWLTSSDTPSEFTHTNSLTSFDSDGFSLGDYSNFNYSGSSFVAWNWKANGSGVSNTNGSITSTVSANQDAGFSIVTWTGNSTFNDSVGHGLGITPKLVFYKTRDTTSDWWTLTTAVDGSLDFLRLNTTDAKNDQSTVSLTSTTIPNWNFSGSMVAYCFHSVDGFSKVGSYTGNGSTDGTFVYTGFRPRWIMIKNAGASGWWTIFDTAREPTNDGSLSVLSAQRSGAESTELSSPFDILSNGFKIRSGSGSSDVNSSGVTYIYLAFAENPFKYTNAR